MISMKYIYAFSICLILACCEKPVIDEESGKKDDTEKKDNNQSGNKGDNGGWANDEQGHKGEWSDGDTVNVYSFINDTYENAVWVKGYIVGCATSTGGYAYTFEYPFQSRTSILIADDKYENDKSNVAAIQLKNGSEIREELNLADNPDNHKRTVAVYGYKTKYLKLTGMKEILDYELK